MSITLEVPRFKPEDFGPAGAATPEILKEIAAWREANGGSTSDALEGLAQRYAEQRAALGVASLATLRKLTNGGQVSAIEDIQISNTMEQLRRGRVVIDGMEIKSSIVTTSIVGDNVKYTPLTRLALAAELVEHVEAAESRRLQRIKTDEEMARKQAQLFRDIADADPIFAVLVEIRALIEAEAEAVGHDPNDITESFNAKRVRAAVTEALAARLQQKRRNKSGLLLSRVTEPFCRARNLKFSGSNHDARCIEIFTPSFARKR